MPELSRLVPKIRSKNAGPFWLTIDLFCGDRETYLRVREGLSDAAVASAYRCDPGRLLRFDIEALNVIKFSLPRPVVQGSREDRDMHASQFAYVIAALTVA